jgi:8-oxo-dGTP pyrophosphatase MutT (NUDIX family)
MTTGCCCYATARDEWELPGGKLELGEDPAICVGREIEEEAGWPVTVQHILDSWVYHICDGVDVLVVTYGCQLETDNPPRRGSPVPVAAPGRKSPGWFGDDLSGAGTSTCV